MHSWGELKGLRAQSVGEVSAYWSCAQFCRICTNERQPGPQLVEKQATPLYLNGKLSAVRLKLPPVDLQSSSLAREGNY